jgi:hypothetical protein
LTNGWPCPLVRVATDGDPGRPCNLTAWRLSSAVLRNYSGFQRIIHLRARKTLGRNQTKLHLLASLRRWRCREWRNPPRRREIALRQNDLAGSNQRDMAHPRNCLRKRVMQMIGRTSLRRSGKRLGSQPGTNPEEFSCTDENPIRLLMIGSKHLKTAEE